MSDGSRHDLVAVDARLDQLADDHEQVLSKSWCDETDEGHYFIVFRCWEHPDVDGAHVISTRYAYLTKGGGGDAWVDWFDAAGINCRVPPGVRPETFLETLADAATQAAGVFDTGRSPADVPMPQGTDR